MIPMFPMTTMADPLLPDSHDSNDSNDSNDPTLTISMIPMIPMISMIDMCTHDFASAQRTWHIAMRYVQLPEYYNISTLNLVWQNPHNCTTKILATGGDEKCGVPPRWAWMRLRNETTAGKEAARPLMGLPQGSLC